MLAAEVTWQPLGAWCSAGGGRVCVFVIEIGVGLRFQNGSPDIYRKQYCFHFVVSFFPPFIQKRYILKFLWMK